MGIGIGKNLTFYSLAKSKVFKYNSSEIRIYDCCNLSKSGLTDFIKPFCLAIKIQNISQNNKKSLVRRSVFCFTVLKIL